MIQSAGLLLFRQQRSGLEVLLAHPGGPLFARKDLGAWTIPKGEFTSDEEPLAAACREFEEETGFAIPGPFLPLDFVTYKSGKRVYAWAVKHDIDATKIKSNEFEMEWPRRSGKRARFPEVDRAAWFTISQAEKKIIPSQQPFLAMLEGMLKS